MKKKVKVASPKNIAREFHKAQVCLESGMGHIWNLADMLESIGCTKKKRKKKKK